MRLPTLVLPLAGLFLLGGLLACGGSAYTPPATPAAPAAPAAATGFTYQNPATDGWALVQNAASTPTHLLLDLVGPAGLKARGVGFNLSSDGSVPFHKFADGGYLADLGVFQLKLATPNLYTTTYPNMYEPTIMGGGTKHGGKLLTVGIYQKDRFQPSQAVNVPLCQIGLDFPASGGPAAGTVIPLQMIRARIIPDDIGGYPSDLNNPDWTQVIKKFQMVDIQIALGTLTAR